MERGIIRLACLLLLSGVFAPAAAHGQGSVHGTAVDGNTGVPAIGITSFNRKTERWGKPATTVDGGVFNLINQEVGEIHMWFNGRGEGRVLYFGTATAKVRQQAPYPSRPERVPLVRTQLTQERGTPPSGLVVSLVKISLGGRRPARRQTPKTTVVSGVVSVEGAEAGEENEVKIVLTDAKTSRVVESKGFALKGAEQARFSFEIKAAADHNLTFFSEDYEPQALLIIKEDPSEANKHESVFEVYKSTGEQLADPASVAVVLKPEAEEEHESEPPVSTEEAARRYVFAPKQMESLPVPGLRSFDYFALLAPGVVPPPATFGESGPGVSPGLGTAGQFSVNGLRSRENNFTVDGSDNNDEDIGTRRGGFAALTPQPIESLQEYQIITALADARFGRNIGGQINALTKTGSPGLHGSLYGFVTSDKFNARNFFDQTAAGGPPATTLTRAVDRSPVLLDGRPVVRQNPSGGEDALTRWQAGYTLGGPFKPLSNTFFFTSLERKNVRATKESHFAVPTVGQRGFLESGETGFLLLSPKGGPATPLTPSSIPGDAVFSLYPFPNNPRGPYGPNTYTAVLPADGKATLVSGKLDKQFGRIDEGVTRPFWSLFAHGDILTGRYNFTQDALTVPVTGGALFSSLRPKVRTQNAAFFLNRALSANVSDSIRFSFGRTRLLFDEVRDPYLTPSAIPNTPFLLNAPLLLNVTAPASDGSLTPTRYVSAAGPAGTSLLNSLGYSGVTQAEQIAGPLGQVIMAGFSPLGVDVYNFPQSRANNTFQIADTLIYTREPHIFTYGFDVRKTQINSTLDRNFRPAAVFNGLRLGGPAENLAFIRRPDAPTQTQAFTGSTLAAAGAPTGLFHTLAADPNSTIGIRYTQVNLFAQDDWRFRPNMMFTFGLRYELNTVPDTVGRRVEQALDPDELRRLAAEAAATCDDPARCGDLVSAITEAFPADFRVSFGSDRNDFDVRLGFVANLERAGGITVRGGFGSYSGQFPGVVLDQSRNVFPRFLPLNYANFSPRLGGRTYLLNLANPSVQQLDPNLGVLTPGTLNTVPSTNPVTILADRLVSLQDLALAPTLMGLDLALPQKGLSTPYSLQSAVTVERTFGRDYLVAGSYVWTRGGKLLRVSTPDGGLNRSFLDENIKVGALTAGSSTPFFQGRFFPAQLDIISKSFTIDRTFFNSDSSSSYHSLQLEVRKSYSRDFQFGSALTYSHAIDDASDFLDLAGSFALPQSSLPRLSPTAAAQAARSERASSNYDVRLRSVTNFVVDLPYFLNAGGGGGSDGRLHAVLANFQLAGVVTAQTGQPYTVNTIFDDNRDGNLTDRLDNTHGLLGGPVGGDDRVLLALAPGTNPLSLLPGFLGRNGNVARNTFRAPGVFNVDLSLSSSFTLREHHTLSYRVEVFNLFNRTNFGIPVRILEHPGFGTAVNTTLPARTIQFAAKYTF